MGGHSAWRKRVARGDLAIQSGGAIARHRPRWGRKGEDLKLNRKGNIAGGNPKKKMKKKTAKKNIITTKDNQQQDGQNEHETTLIGRMDANWRSPMKILIIAAASIFGLSFLAILQYLLS